MTSLIDKADIQQDELAIARARLEEKEKQIQDLKIRVDVLEGLLQRLTAQRAPQSQLQPFKAAPRRWNAR